MSSDATELDAGVVLLVNGEPASLSEACSVLARAGYEVHTATTIAAAREAFREMHGLMDLIVLDPAIENGAGQLFLRDVRAGHRELPIAVLTANRALEYAIFALRHGAFDYLVQPCRADELLAVVELGVERAQMVRELSVRRMLEPGITGDDGVFTSAPMRNIAGVVEQVKDSSVPVMILGETGTGKEVIARLIHRSSKRRERPFVAVNCASLPRELAESELFGHERGAFTGAEKKKEGYFALAKDGVLFLDEVGELDPSVQAKLLRVLQENEITPVGGQATKVQMRVIVATNRDLEDDVRQGRFRADLFFRLNVITLRVPPLRERREEIAPLAVFLLERFVRRDGIDPKTLSAEAIAVLEAEHFPGNVRELESVLKRTALLTRGRVIRVEDLRLEKTDDLPIAPPKVLEELEENLIEHDSVMPLSQYERQMLARALTEARGNISAASRRLGISRSTFYRKAKRYDLPL